MLNSDAFKQLAQLKQEIIAAKDYATGTVVGSNGRFGFVKLEDGRDAFLSPEKMQRVIPGDVVKVSVTSPKEGKWEGELEALLSPALGRFIGTYRIKGKAHFVEPEGAQASRWIFLPPNARGAKIKDGEIVIARLQSHPFKDGKAVAKVLERVGNRGESKFPLKYIKAKYQLNREDAKGSDGETEALEKRFVHEQFGERTDDSERLFVTIDAATTKDMDDALAYTRVDSEAGPRHHLSVAIADPASFIQPGDALARNSLERGQTTYLLGGNVPMLPLPLSHHSFSLEEGKKRPALLCEMQFDDAGQLLNFRFERAVIRSAHKLAYEDVARFLAGEAGAVPESAQALLSGLHNFARQRRQFREANFLVSADQDDYDYQLDDNGNIEGITPRPRNAAHGIVEEAMLATNLCAAQTLKEHGLGLFSVHPGFREERLGEVKALLKEENIAFEDLNALAEHVALFHTLAANSATEKLVAPLRRMTANADISPTAAPHLGMGVEAYATITSPIRRYADLYNHWCLQQILGGKPAPQLKDQQVQQLRETLAEARNADRELYQWLISDYAERLVGQCAQGQVRIVTQQGFGVRLVDNGVEGFVLFPKDKEKKFDAKRMTLTVDDVLYYIGQAISVKVKSVDKVKRRIAFELA